MNGTGSIVKTRRSKSSGVIVPHNATATQRVGAWIVYALVRCLESTLRMRWVDRSGFFDSPCVGAAIYCVWHEQLAVSMKAYFSYISKRRQSPGLAAMVSASRDGGFLAGILQSFGVQPVRGSSSRRGPQALLEMTSWAERGYDIAITPDGPRGPRHIVQEGVASLAQLTGLPIVPVGIRLGWKFCLKSWDRFQIPMPFSECEMIFEKPIRVPRECSDTERERLRRELETVLKELATRPGCSERR